MSGNHQEYFCQSDLNLYDSPSCEKLATQVAKGRHLRLLLPKTDSVIKVYLCEDGYQAWLPMNQVNQLKPANKVYQHIPISRNEIEKRLPAIADFMKTAMAQPNYYLWGGTVAPNYDCSGLMQAAFAASGIWLPRDSYQQVDFTQRITKSALELGDLIFFAKKERVDHVAFYLGDGFYIHSSGIEMGRNGIGIDRLIDNGDRVSQTYYQQLWGFGRVMSSYLPN
jgi:cell wall-associated NlpC family hydrolase